MSVCVVWVMQLGSAKKSAKCVNVKIQITGQLGGLRDDVKSIRIAIHTVLPSLRDTT